MVYTMKHLYETHPFLTGLVFGLLYICIDVADARWFIPKTVREAKQCQLSDVCREWIHIRPEVLNVKVLREGY